MNKKITLKFQGVRVVTTFGWAVLLILGLLSRGTVPDSVFWLVIVSIALLLIIDTIYFIARVSQGHYIIITHRKIIFKRFFQEIMTLPMNELNSITVTENKLGNTIIVLTSDDVRFELKHDYIYSKDMILENIQHAHFFPKDVDIVDKRSKDRSLNVR